MKYRIAGTFIFIFCFMLVAEVLHAQDANYVVAEDAPEIKVYNHDDEKQVIIVQGKT